MSCSKHEPQRQCAACRAVRPKAEMIRVACPKDGEPVIDETGKMPGRGAYLCRSAECLEKALKKGSLARALHHPVPAEVTEQLNEIIRGTTHA